MTGKLPHGIISSGDDDRVFVIARALAAMRGHDASQYISYLGMAREMMASFPELTDRLCIENQKMQLQATRCRSVFDQLMEAFQKRYGSN